MQRVVRLALFFFCISCGRQDEAAERSRVLYTLDALRDAPSDALAARRKLLAELEATAATAPNAVRARDSCVAAYRLLLDGTELQRGVQADLSADSGSAASLVPRLLEAEVKIKQSGERMPDCEQASAVLRLGRR